MSSFRIGEMDGDSELIERRRANEGCLELWKNVNNGYFVVYLYDNERDDEWILHAVKGSEEKAHNILDLASAMFD